MRFLYHFPISPHIGPSFLEIPKARARTSAVGGRRRRRAQVRYFRQSAFPWKVGRCGAGAIKLETPQPYGPRSASTAVEKTIQKYKTNRQKGKSKLWYYIHRTNKEYREHQKNGKAFAADHTPAEILKTCRYWIAPSGKEYLATTSKLNSHKHG